mgnify:CR=1 FL=1
MKHIAMNDTSRLTGRQERLINLLSNGGKYSAIDIANRLHIGDARSEIRRLRNMGYVVSDEWKNPKDGEGLRYKLYFMRDASLNVPPSVEATPCSSLEESPEDAKRRLLRAVRVYVIKGEVVNLTGWEQQVFMDFKKSYDERRK